MVLFLYLFFLFCSSFHFSELYQNNLNGTIPTQIGLMTSLTQLWEWKKKKSFIKIYYSFFSFSFFLHFSELFLNNLNGTIPTQIGLMTSLTQLWEEKKEKRNEAFIKFVLFFYRFFIFLNFISVIFLKTI